MIAITHGHGDHVGDTVELSQRFPDAEIVCQVELKKWLRGKGANVGDVPGLNKGGSLDDRRDHVHAHRRQPLVAPTTRRASTSARRAAS